VEKRRLAASFHIVPPIVFLSLAGVFSGVVSRVVLEPPFLLPLLNSSFLSLIPFIIAFFAARSYRQQGAGIFLLLGCSMISTGLSNLFAGWGLAVYGDNFTVTIHNLGSLVAGSCHLAGVAWIYARPSGSGPVKGKAVPTVAAAYSAVFVLLVLLGLLTSSGSLPVFFLHGRGPTLLRQAVLTAAAMTYALSAIMLVGLHARTRMRFFALYANALFLVAIGLGAVLIGRDVGGILGWIGRTSQYVGSVYFIMALIVGRRETGSEDSSLPEYLTELFRSQLDGEVRTRTRDLLDLNRRLQEEARERQAAERRLRESEETYRSVIENSLQGVSMLQDGRIVLCNDALCTMNGYSRDEAYRMTQEQVLATIHTEDRPPVIEMMKALATPGLPPPARLIRLLNKAGGTHWVEVLGGRSPYLGRPAIQLSYIDVTEKRRAEEAYRTLVDNAVDGFAILQNGRVVFANSALARICGCEIPELLRMSPEEVAGVVHPDDRARILQNMARRLAGGDPPRTESFRILHRNGSTLVVGTHSVFVDFEGSPAIQVSFEDVTAARAAEEKLSSTHQKMRNLAAHLLYAREEERRKVAQEIHDEFGQALAALKMDMHWLDKHLRGVAPDVAEKIKGMIRLSEQTIGMVQSVSSQLRPRMLDDLGLAPALDWLAADFSRRTTISCTVETDFPSALIGGNAATTLYRVVQEALSNVARHSQARKCAIQLRATRGGIVLRIEDDGIGITPAQAAAAESYGIIGIHERVEGLGGSLSIVGSRESGSTLLVRIPLPGEGGLA
jgi:PAS domain S-box-containing protein